LSVFDCVTNQTDDGRACGARGLAARSARVRQNNAGASTGNEHQGQLSHAHHRNSVSSKKNNHHLTVWFVFRYSPFVGSAEKTVRDCFERARGVVPCIVFIDELEAMVSKRGNSNEVHSLFVLDSVFFFFCF
jgi:hypothetical protein